MRGNYATQYVQRRWRHLDKMGDGLILRVHAPPMIDCVIGGAEARAIARRSLDPFQPRRVSAARSILTHLKAVSKAVFWVTAHFRCGKDDIVQSAVRGLLNASDVAESWSCWLTIARRTARLSAAGGCTHAEDRVVLSQ